MLHRLFHWWTCGWELVDIKQPGWVVTIRCTKCGALEVLK